MDPKEQQMQNLAGKLIFFANALGALWRPPWVVIFFVSPSSGLKNGPVEGIVFVEQNKGFFTCFWRHRAPMQRGTLAKSLPCSVALKVLGVTSAPALSRVMFSSIWGFVVFVVLHVWLSRALFSDSPWPSDPLLQTSFFHLGAPALYFPGCGAFLFSVFGVAFGCTWLPFGSLGPVGPG